MPIMRNMAHWQLQLLLPPALPLPLVTEEMQTLAPLMQTSAPLPLRLLTALHLARKQLHHCLTLQRAQRPPASQGAVVASLRT